MIAKMLCVTGCLWPLLALAGEAAQPVEAGPKPGIWVLRGVDSRPWQARMLLQASGQRVYGSLRWQSEAGVESGGEEAFEGQHDPATGWVTLRGQTLKEARGDIASGTTYEATLSADGSRLESGRWFGPDTQPGTWSAVWQRPLPSKLP